MKKMQRGLAAVLTGAVVASSMTFGAFAAKFADTEGHWGASSVERWADYGVVQGSDGLFNPDASMTRAELATVLVNLLGLTEKGENTFSDVQSGAWFEDAILKCAAAGIIKGDGTGANPNGQITREEAAVMLGRALGIVPKSGSVSFDDGAQVSDWAAGYVKAMSDKGIINGVGGNAFAPKIDISRASVTTILDKSISTYVNEPGSYTVEAKGIVLVKAAGEVTLTGAADSVLVAAGAEKSGVTLDKLTVSGAVTVDAKMAEVTAKDAKLADVIMNAEQSALKLSGASTAETVTVSPSAPAAVLTIDKTAKIDLAVIAAQGTTTSIAGAVKDVSVAETASDTKISVEKGATVGSLETAGDKTAVSGSGKIEDMTVTGGEGTTVSKETTVDKVENKGESDVTVGGKPVAPETSTENKPSTGGSTGGSGSSWSTVDSFVDNIADTVTVTTKKNGTNYRITLEGTVDSGIPTELSSLFDIAQFGDKKADGYTAVSLTGVISAGASRIVQTNAALQLYASAEVDFPSDTKDKIYNKEAAGDYAFLLAPNAKSATITVYSANAGDTLESARGSVIAKYEITNNLKFVTVVETAEELKAALAHGGDVKLGEDISLGNGTQDAELGAKEPYLVQVIVPEGKIVHLNLNGHEITTIAEPKKLDNNKVKSVYMLLNQGTLEVDGTVAGSAITTGYETNPNTEQTRGIMNFGGTMTLNGGTYNGYYALVNNLDLVSSERVGTLTIKDATVVAGFSGVVNFKNGHTVLENTDVTADYYALNNNGTYGGTEFIATECELTSNEDTAIYFPAGDKLYLTNCTVSAPASSAIEAFAGDVQLLGTTTVSAGGSYVEDIPASGSGSIMDGSAVLLGYRAGYKTGELKLSLTVDETVSLSSTNGNCIRLVAIGTYAAGNGANTINLSFYEDSNFEEHNNVKDAFLNAITEDNYQGTCTINAHSTQAAE